MARRLAVLLLILAGTVLFAAPAYGRNLHHVACHGSNNVPCRPDPQPLRQRLLELRRSLM
jgi:hypothetical protein